MSDDARRGHGPERESAPAGEDGGVELSIVMPCLNEAKTVGACVRKAQRFISAHGLRGEVVVADNGSTDGSIEIARSLGARVISVEGRGYGAALAGGIAAASGRFIVMGDADESYDFEALEPFLGKLREGFDLVMGNRFQGGVKPGAMPPLHRLLGNPVLTGIGRVFFRSPVGDFHCGLRGFRKAAVLEMNLQTTGMEFASEMVVKATLLDQKIAEVPTVLHPDGRGRRGHLRSWRDGWRHLRFMLLYSPNWLFLYPGLLVTLAGLTVGIWLMPGARRVGDVTLDVHTLLYAALAVLLGFEAVWFSLFSKVFAIGEGLLPRDRVLDRLSAIFTLEGGLLAGGCLVGLGVAGSFYAVQTWGQQSFGPLEPSQTFRIVIPSVLAIMSGSQIVLSSFFLSVLGLRRQGARGS